ncbi:MAG: hypothetical protein RLZZ452_1215, partial [Pseudomonadota bacterium]
VAEEKFVAEGFADKRIEVMYNDFVLIGPKSDPAKVAGGKDIQAALKKIADSKSTFVSRGDKSGTHAAELRYWKGADIAVSANLPWYKETGSGMGPALNTASGMNGYILSDRATWLTKHPNVKKAEGQAFVDWITSKEGQDTIASYKVGGEQLFFPNAKK